MARVRAVGDAEFDEVVLGAPGIVVVDFWASWCAPCTTMAPVVRELAEYFGDRLRFVAMDVDAEPRTAARYGVRLVPTFLVLRDGELEATLTGARPKPALRDELEAIVTGEDRDVRDFTHPAGGGRP